MNSELVRVMAEIFALNAQMEAMKAANVVAAIRGDYPLWGYDDFREVERQFEQLGQQAVQCG
jgi:hypothetical protein